MIVLHSDEGAPGAPALFKKHVLFLTARPSEASLQMPFSKNSIDSVTAIDPLMLKVLILAALLAHS